MAFSPFKFLQEVRSETAKVTWPSRRETMITTIMVFVMVALSSIFSIRISSYRLLDLDLQPVQLLSLSNYIATDLFASKTANQRVRQRHFSD